MSIHLTHSHRKPAFGGRGSRRRSIASILLAGTLAGPLQASDLRLEVDALAGVLIQNRSSIALAPVALHAGTGWRLDCPGQGQGEGVAALASLPGQATRYCAGDASRAERFSAVAASAVRTDGGSASSHASRTLLQGVGESIVLVAGGAVHADTDADGVLDAGESIDYHYTLLNLGDFVLSDLQVVDESGAVGCPGTTLAVNASMVCTRSYAITAGDQAAGLVINQVDVDGVDSLGRGVGATDVLVSQNLAGRAGVRVFKSPKIVEDADANGVASVGDLIRYTFVIKNSGAETLGSVLLSEPDPTRIDTAIVCSATTLEGAPFAGNGSGSLLSNHVLTCSADYTVRASDAAIRQVLNVAEVNAVAPVAGTVIATAASTVVVPVPPVIGVSKDLISSTGEGPGPYAVHYAIVVGNYGTTALFDVQVEEDLRRTFPLPVGFTVTSVTVTGSGAPNPGFDGVSDTSLLDAAASSLTPGDAMTIDLRLSVSPGVLPGPYFNQVFASGRDSIDQAVADASVSGMNPDPDGDGIPNENSPTPVAFNVQPPIAIPAGGPLALVALVLLLAATAGLRRRA